MTARDELRALTAEEWQYLSVLVAADVRNDQMLASARRHQPIWDKIQKLCEWDDE